MNELSEGCGVGHRDQSMSCYLRCTILLLLIFSKAAGAFPSSGLDGGGSRTQRDVQCKDNQYLNGDICCQNCPAGSRMLSPCTTAGTKGDCVECDDGTYTQHANDLGHCFKCTQCRSDQEIVRACTHTQDTECQCKAGGFCAPDQACEVCKKCSRCQEDEEIVRNCTSTANTECKKIQPKAASDSGKASVIVPLVLVAALVIGLIIFFGWRCKAKESQRNFTDGRKVVQHSDSCPVGEGRNRDNRSTNCSRLIASRQLVRASAGMEDERKVLCESLNSSASNSQHSLTGLPSSAYLTTPARASPIIPREPDRRDDEPFPRLVPLNGVESLKKCFEYFEDLDFKYHKRFFRHLGITDNKINSKDHLLYEDRIHELLNIWVEKEGKEASLNDLLKALLDLNQRQTAEIIKERAVDQGHYLCEDNDS